MGYFQTAMGKLVTGEGSKRGNSAYRVEFKMGVKTQVCPRNSGLHITEDAGPETS